MRKTIRNLAASCAVAALVVTPMAAGMVLLTAEDAVAKAGDKKKAKAGGGQKAKAQKKAKKEKAAKVKKTKPEKAEKAKAEKVKAEKPTKPKERPERGATANLDEDETQQDIIEADDDQVVILDDDSGDEPLFGNPGNDKAVGRAGETPNGDEDGWGEGTRGRSDVDRSAETDDDEDDGLDDILEDIVEDDDPDADDADGGIAAADILVPEEIFDNADASTIDRR